MRILLLFLAFLPLACSQEDPVEPEPEVIEITLYYLKLAPECNMTNLETHQVTEEIYESVLGLHEIGDCGDYHTLPDIEGVWHEGYLMGEAKETQQQ